MDVNEEGTEAAAATGGVMMMRAMMIPVVFTVDRPFIFVIQDTNTHLIKHESRTLNIAAHVCNTRYKHASH